MVYGDARNDQAFAAPLSMENAGLSLECALPTRLARVSGAPLRPALAPGVVVRRQVVEGRPSVFVHAAGGEGLVVLGEREWTLLRAADGTRDLEGIVQAARRHGVRRAVEEVGGWFAELLSAGVLIDASLTSSHAERVAHEAREHARVRMTNVRPERSLVPLPEFRLRCDGRGSCCRFYPTTLFSEAEAARARALVPDVLAGGDDGSRVFTAADGGSGSSVEAIGVAFSGLAVAMVDGRCAYLGPEGCRIHAAGGASAKPLGCRSYPARFVDDGEVVRVAPALECACVFRSARRCDDGDAEPLTTATTTSTLDPAVVVDSVPLEIRVTSERSWTRSEYLAWHRECSRGCDGGAAGLDALEQLEGFARALWGTSSESSARAFDARALTLQAVDSLATRARRRHQLHAAVRSPKDLARLVPRWIERAAERVLHEELGAPTPLDEAFYVRAMAFAHGWLDGDAPLVVSIARRAASIAIARHFDAVVSDEERRGEPALDHPLALVEAAARTL